MHTVARSVLREKRYRALRTRLEQFRELRHLASTHRGAGIVPVKEPLVLISQIQRSGGTLLSQLFDGHPEIHAHPHELCIGSPRKDVWPAIPVDGNVDLWFKTLFEGPVIPAFWHGYGKYSRKEADEERLPFLLVPSLQRDIFRQCLREGAGFREREVFDAFMTSYFNAWLDNQNLYGARKRWITGFVPRMVMEQRNLEEFFRVYPDGKLVSMMRDPRTWFVSARLHKPAEYGDIQGAIALWKRSTAASVAAKLKYPKQTHLVLFEDLVGHVEPTMRRLAAALRIDFSDVLLTPTFNRLPIKADSSFRVENHGLIASPLHRSSQLTARESEYIQGETSELVDRFRRAANDSSEATPLLSTEMTS
jgi:hypothetical protein